MNLDDRPEIFKALLDLGLTKNEAKVYMTLVGMGEGKASEIARKSGVTREKTYRVLKRLEEKRLVKIIEGQPMRWRAIPPEDVFKPLIERRRKLVEEMQNVIEELQKIYDLSREKGKREELNVWEISEKDFENIYASTIETCRRYLYAVLTPSALDTFISPIIMKSIKKLSKSGIDIKIVTWLIDDSIHGPARLSNYSNVYILNSDIPEYSYIVIDGYTGFIIKEGRSSIIHYSDTKIGGSIENIFKLAVSKAVSLTDYMDYYDALGTLAEKDVIDIDGIRDLLIRLINEMIYTLGKSLNKDIREEIKRIVGELTRDIISSKIKNYIELSLSERIKLLTLLLRKTLDLRDLRVSVDKLHNQLYLNIDLYLTDDNLDDIYRYLSSNPDYPNPIITLMDHEIRSIGYKRINPLIILYKRDKRITFKYSYKILGKIKTQI